MKCDFSYYQMVYPKIIEGIRLVASPPETQTILFPKILLAPYEIADLFEEIIIYASILEKNNYITSQQLFCLKEIKNVFQRFTEQEWSIEMLCSSPNWASTRKLAEKALRRFDVEYAKPNLYWIVNQK